MTERVNWWTAEEDETILRMTGEGKSASTVGRVIGRTKASVISRNRRLKAPPKPAPDTKVRFTSAEDAVIAEMSDAGKSGSAIALALLNRTKSSIIKRARTIGKPLHGKSGQAKRERPPGGKVIPFPTPRHKLQANYSPRKAQPALRVVSNNVPLMVKDWLDKNGGPRRFDGRETTDTWVIRTFLEERGIKLNGHQRKWSISMNGRGRPKTGTWADVMEIVDELRMAEGLQPFCAGAVSRRRNTGAVG